MLPKTRALCHIKICSRRGSIRPTLEPDTRTKPSLVERAARTKAASFCTQISFHNVASPNAPPATSLVARGSRSKCLLRWPNIVHLRTLYSNAADPISFLSLSTFLPLHSSLHAAVAALRVPAAGGRLHLHLHVQPPLAAARAALLRLRAHRLSAAAVRLRPGARARPVRPVRQSRCGCGRRW